MTSKTRVIHVRVVGFSAPERQMLNSIFLLSVAPARQIGYKLWVAESGVAPDMYLLDGDSESAVASWQAAFSNTSERTLVVGSKNTDLGCASAARPLGLKVVGAMDRLAIALNSTARETSLHDVSSPRAGASLPGAGDSSPAPAPKLNATLPRAAATMNSPSPAASSMAATMANTVSASVPASAAATMNATINASAAPSAAASPVASMPAAAAPVTPPPMTASAPPPVLPHVTLQPNTVAALDKSAAHPLNSPAAPAVAAPIVPPSSGATPLSPSALAAAVAPSATRTNLRVVTNHSPLAASLPQARAVDAASATHAPLNVPAPPAALVPPPVAVTPTPVVAAPAPVVAVPPASVTSRADENSFRVLAVDDSPLMRTFLQNKLQPYGISPEFASSGEEALFKISKQHFDLIFLDVMLPGMDGYDVCKMIKKNKDNSLMRVIMLTSKDKTFDKIRGKMAGCDDYLTKPVDELKLRAIVERHSPKR
jgi:CheY-like chemotaxis protein